MSGQTNVGRSDPGRGAPRAADNGPTESDHPPKKLRWSDVPGEPYRLFFPLGLLAGVFAVLLWPLFFYGLWFLYPGPSHGRLMILSFFGAFVVGFLGTAAPRMLEVRSLSWPELSGLLAVYLTGTAAYFGGALAVGDAAFFFFFAGFAGMLAVRFRRRSDLPPPSFALVVWGYAHLPIGLLLLLAGGVIAGGPAWTRIGLGIVSEGAFLCMIAGVGAFFFPRLLGCPPRQRFPGSPVPDPEWRRAAIAPFAVGGLVLASFVIEHLVHGSAGILLRYAAIAAYLVRMVPLWYRPENPGFLILSLRIGLLAVPLGGLAMALFPDYRMAGLHTVLVAGFGMITLVVATRVVFGHAGRRKQIEGRAGFLAVVLGLIVTAAAVRFLADVFPGAYAALLGKAAFLWVAGILVWARYTVPLAFRPDPED